MRALVNRELQAVSGAGDAADSFITQCRKLQAEYGAGASQVYVTGTPQTSDANLAIGGGGTFARGLGNLQGNVEIGTTSSDGSSVVGFCPAPLDSDDEEKADNQN